MRRTLLIFATALSIISSQEAEERYNPEQPYCFKFTWLGLNPQETNVTNSCNTTEPCFQPVSVSDDGNLPDTNQMWREENRTQFSCALQHGFVCIKYTWTFNDAVQNISYFCGKMVENKQSPIVDGCYSQQVNSHVVEACACTSAAGAVPCNSSEFRHPSIPIILALGMLSWISVSNF
ncbi:uncharacterized protein LOC135163357 [Diachasmimorpha longicaudata]|uniref:uncharacterized protein LOC135163357 n=1 Tax=Diachasmimorpha longicaudata TaxID=58733 RepID=UPI0030B8722C